MSVSLSIVTSDFMYNEFKSSPLTLLHVFTSYELLQKVSQEVSWDLHHESVDSKCL